MAETSKNYAGAMKLQTKALLFIVSIALLPLLLYCFLTLRQSQAALSTLSQQSLDTARDHVFESLNAVRASKSAQVHDYFKFLQDQNELYAADPFVVQAMVDMNRAFEALTKNAESDRRLETYREAVGAFYSEQFDAQYVRDNPKATPPGATLVAGLSSAALLFQHDFIAASPHPLGEKDKLLTSARGSAYDRLHEKVHPFMSTFRETFGFYDIFLIDAETGHVVYSVFKEIDFATSLRSGPFATSGLAEAFKGALARSAGGHHLTDYRNYTPSYEAPASFTAAPIQVNGKTVGVVAFQMPLDRIGKIMNDRTGLGETGEAILVGSDFFPRSDSFFDTERYSVVNAFRHGDAGKLNFSAIAPVFNSNQGGALETRDYLDREVITVFAPIQIGENTWALAVSQTKSEALAVAEELAHTSQALLKNLWSTALMILAPTLVIVLVLSLIAVRGVLGPIQQVVAFTKQVAGGDLSNRLALNRKDELGTLVDAVNSMVTDLNGAMRTAAESARLVSSRAQLLDQRGAALEVSTRETMRETQEIGDRAEAMTKAVSAIASEAEATAGQADTVSRTVHLLAAETDEITATLGLVSRNLQQVSAAFEEVTVTVAEISRTCAGATQISSAGSENVAKVSDQMRSLAGSTAKIDAVISLIKSIAEQTNLLALNATIEAAAAGNAGAGFAVVASEVKALAQKTREATGNIFTQVRALQEESQVAESDTHKVRASIEELNEINMTVATAVEEQERTIEEVAKNLVQTSSDTQDIEKGVSGIADGLNRINQMALASGGKARSMNQSAAGVEKEVLTVNQGVGRISDKTRDVHDFAVEINQTASELREMAENLNQVVARFRLEPLV